MVKEKKNAGEASNTIEFTHVWQGCTGKVVMEYKGAWHCPVCGLWSYEVK